MSQEVATSEDIVQLTAFKVGGEEYVVDILRIREIIKPLPITPVRRGPRFVEGVISLRGAIIPVVDMRRRFGVKPSADEELRERVIILVIDSRVVGLMVDKVTEVVRVPRTQIRPAPGLLADDQAPFHSQQVVHASHFAHQDDANNTAKHHYRRTPWVWALHSQKRS